MMINVLMPELQRYPECVKVIFLTRQTRSFQVMTCLTWYVVSTLSYAVIAEVLYYYYGVETVKYIGKNKARDA